MDKKVYIYDDDIEATINVYKNVDDSYQFFVVIVDDSAYPAQRVISFDGRVSTE